MFATSSFFPPPPNKFYATLGLCKMFSCYRIKNPYCVMKPWWRCDDSFDQLMPYHSCRGFCKYKVSLLRIFCLWSVTIVNGVDPTLIDKPGNAVCCSWHIKYRRTSHNASQIKVFPVDWFLVFNTRLHTAYLSFSTLFFGWYLYRKKFILTFQKLNTFLTKCCACQLYI